MSNSIKFELKNYNKSLGSYFIYLRVTIDRKIKRYNTEQRIEEKYWNTKGFVKGDYPLYIKINRILETIKGRANNVIADLPMNKEEITFENFEKYFLDKNNNNNKMDFYAFMQTFIDQKKNIYKPGVIKMYKGEMSKMKKFKPEVTFGDVNYNFLIGYENYMRATLGNKTNTVTKTIKKIKALTNEAIRQGIIKDNPLKDYILKSEPTKREFLTIEEVGKLELFLTQEDVSEKLKSFLKYFLFCCYTGLRYEDLKYLKFEDILGNIIKIKQLKTSDYVSIPLSDRALKLLPKFTGLGNIIFKVIANQKCNEYLKIIMLYDSVKINKNISFHCSRHTFATISLNIGIPLDVVSKLLGHTDIKTTQIYAKLLDSTKITEMQKWNSF